MKLHFCVACGEQDVGLLEYHHLVPRPEGGSNDERNLLTLCHVCHGLAHGYVRRNIGALVKAGIAKARARGVRVGGKPGREPGWAIAARRQKAMDHATIVAPIIFELKEAGITSKAALARALTERGILTSYGYPRWHDSAVTQVLKFYAEAQRLAALNA